MPKTQINTFANGELSTKIANKIPNEIVFLQGYNGLKPIKLFDGTEQTDNTETDTKNETEIYPPFNAIDGLGDTVAKNIVEEREKKPFLSIEDLQKRCKISGTLIEKMRLMGILDGMDESSQLTLF